MYHIKPDKRAENSARLICEGMSACLKEKSFENITISDLQRASGVSRSTFYRSFDRMEDVLALMCDSVFEEAFSAGYENISEAVFTTWFRHQEMIETVVRIKRSDILFDSLRRCAEETFEFTGTALFEYMVSIVSSSMMGIMVTWVERGKKENEDELKNMIIESLGAMKLIGIDLTK